MDRSELLEIITKAKQSGQKKLDLSGKWIQEVPESIGQLTNLTYLNLSSNQLTALPESIGQLINLTYLNLSSNQLTALPESIGQLINLTYLNLSSNQLTALPESIGQLINLTYLNLSSNQLTALPESIGQLSNLASLYLRSIQLTVLPDWIGQLSNLISLYLSDNQLTVLPESIGQLTNLISLYFDANQLTVLPESIGQLTNLTSLNFDANQLTVLPESIGQLTNLTSLYFTSNKLRTLPESIGQLSNLISLYLGNNQLTLLPESIGRLTNLTSLNLGNNQLTLLPESIGQLANLNSFNLISNQLRTLPESIGQLSNLISLYLISNQLRTLPESIGQLSNLTSLYLSYNQLKVLPESIGQLINLTSLNLSPNQLELLPESIGQLINLTSLNLSSNQLELLPESIGRLINLKPLNIDSNPLNKIPPEVVKKGSIAVLDYYRQRLEEQTDYIYEAKLLIIGEGGAGKTSLANKLINSKYQLKLEGSKHPEKTTEGIDVLRLDFPHSSGNSFRMNLWDFGGQEIYHATHQFFLTKRSLYLLIADTRQDNTDFNYWLEIVELLSESSPALIIKNEKQDRPCQVNENQLRERFPNLEKILSTNLSTNRGLPAIRAAIQHHISQLPHIGTPLPKTWVRVREALEADNRNYITQAEFLTLCDIYGFKRRENKLQLSGYLHDLGVCLHFQEDPILKNWIILKPEWGTTAVYTVLDTPKVQESLGYFTQADLATIWSNDQYSDMRDELLHLMMRFKLCYEIPHRPRTYIAPQLLSPNQPKYDWTDRDNLILRYKYEFMPKGMLTRFTVEMHRLIDRDLVWKEGVILIQDNARAEVIEAYYKNEIRIRISGKLKKSLLEIIRYEFCQIHDSYEKLRYQEFIPCNCSICKGSQTPHSYPLKRLEERLRNNRQEIECDISYTMVSVRDLIDDAIGSSQPVPVLELDYNKLSHEPTIVPPFQLNFSINQSQTQEQPVANTTNNLQGANIGNFANEVKDQARQQANQNIQNSEKQSLAEAAKEIQTLIDQLAQSYPTTTMPEKVGFASAIVQQIDINPSLSTRVLSASKAGGTAAIGQFLNHPLSSFIIAAIEDWQKTKQP
jgi:internalin A